MTTTQTSSFSSLRSRISSITEEFLERALQAFSDPEYRAKIIKFYSQPTFILGLSGGPDSTFLLHLLLSLKPQPTIILAHVNYHLRGHDSLLDEQFVRNLAKKHGLKLEVLDVKAAKLKGNLEENCRNLRYEFFEKLRRQYNACFTLTAHNQGDQSETFLLNLIRGANFRGLSAMSDFSPRGQIYRPLLDTPKSFILSWLKENKIPFRTDKTNTDIRFTRNFLRHKIIPLIEQLNPNFQQTLQSTIKNNQENREIIENATLQWMKNNLKTVKNTSTFSLSTFLSTPQGLQRKVIDTIYGLLNNQSLTTPHNHEILTTLRRNRAGLRKSFGPHRTMKITKSPSGERLVVIESNPD